MDPNASSTLQLHPASSRLCALDEDCQLQIAPSATSSNPPEEQQQVGRLRRASNVVQTKLGLKKEKGEDVEPSMQKPLTPGGIPRDYTTNMVDVLDTVGKWSVRM